jgi:hypothetical protein
MASRILSDLSVGVTAEIAEALETAVAFSGIKASQFCRIALTEKLVREGIFIHPGAARVEKSALKNPEIKSQAAI